MVHVAHVAPDRAPLACQRALFDLPPDTDEGALAYFDGAGRSPLMRTSHAAGVAAISHKLRPWLMPGGDDDVSEVRALFAELVGARRASGRDIVDGDARPGEQHGGRPTPGTTSDERREDDPVMVALTPSTSYAMSLCARNVRMEAGQRAVVLWDQMASNVMPWQQAGALGKLRV